MYTQAGMYTALYISILTHTNSHTSSALDPAETSNDAWLASPHDRVANFSGPSTARVEDARSSEPTPVVRIYIIKIAHFFSISAFFLAQSDLHALWSCVYTCCVGAYCTAYSHVRKTSALKLQHISCISTPKLISCTRDSVGWMMVKLNGQKSKIAWSSSKGHVTILGQ